ncbi:hypothetical protein [Pimelobacter simplex]|uniref:hypothetical protein n=1 Tax=Nocardioides simplex TaxID=2045 RepID=UPI0021506A19|nr:hypothetical protein [Pimelobacter simplex]UUW89464.1 hypothetical protein M0M43_27605 [Pimelobacter simplex]UUW93293.1 hypothetical protein M0M48_16260 [Pimelobacter simplex]
MLTSVDPVRALVRQELLRLADLEEAAAAREATSVPYWAPCPATVHGHRAAALALRADAERYLA